MKAEDPSSVAETYMLSMRYLRSEQVRVLYLNHQNRLIFEEVLEQGGISSVSISERQIIKTALSHHASNLILLHNHPGGDPTPSIADLQVTESIRNAAKSLDIHLLDHIIIGDGVYYSMKEQGVPSGSLSEENET